ncbi:MAG TPA: MobF family relaxase [Microthrixaceae bacterium]|jgi:conjugative relaxase-like TrwC/TraI family protein|nr:MobF family relaxase [Microthrixaceae bacterium]
MLDLVLSIAKLRVGQEAYTLSGVAQSLDDYYTGRGEADGVWLGVGAERLGLDGPVAADDLRAVLAGIAPGTGGLTPDGETLRTHPRRVPGFDLTFKAPKSVSVLYAVSDDPRVQGQIIEAGEAAVRQTVQWLEREAMRVRRGSGDAAYLNDLAARDPEAAEQARVRVLPGRGVVAATFRHRTSRAGDPLLHWHTLIANLVEGPDGRWGAFVHPELYRNVRAAGELFQTALRAELTDRLGLEWRPGRHVPEVAGVPQHLCDQFSKRAAEIEAWLEATGTPNDRAGRQAAVLATRKGKPEVEGERFDADWKLDALAAGWGPADAEALITATAGHTVGFDEVWRLPDTDPDSGAVVDRTVPVEEWIADLGRALTTNDTTFGRPDLVEAIAARIGDGASVATVDRIVAQVLASPQIVPIADGDTQRWTTTDMLAVERRFLATAHDTRSTRTPVDPVAIEYVIADMTLGDDQAAAVRTLTGASDAVSVLVGPAGTGKTFTLDAVRALYQSAGHDVIGVAPSARAAHELATDAHIPAATIHSQLGAWDRGFDRPTARTVLIVDEAAMAGVRELERVLRPVVAAGGRVVLVGDHHQLPEITAGGSFAALATNPEVTVATLTVNRRQHHAWERDALDELRQGHVPAAVAAYQANDRIVVTDDRTAMIDAAVDRWIDAHRNGTVPVLLAGTNELVDAVNQAVRARLLDAGILTDNTEHLAVGERLVMRINDYRAADIDGAEVAVLNGQTATLTGRTDDGGLVVRMDHDDTLVNIEPVYVQAGGVDYAYATTAHRAQGGTWDLAIAVGLDGLYREAGYLVMSRGRQSNWLVVTQPELDRLDGEIGRHDSALPLPVEAPEEVEDLVERRLRASRRKALATTRDPHAATIDWLATTRPLAALEKWAAHASAVDAAATQRLGHHPQVVRDRIARTRHTAEHVAVGQRVKAWDRRNIGTVTALDDPAGTVHVTFVSANGSAARRSLGWGDITIVDPTTPTPRVLDGDTRALVDSLVDRLDHQLENWTGHLAQHGVEPDDAHVYRSAASLAVDRNAAALQAAEPEWLLELLGARPTHDPAATQVWEDAVRDLAAARLRHAVISPAEPTRTDRSSPVWADAGSAVIDARQWLDTNRSIEPAKLVRRDSAELRERGSELDRLLATAPPDVRGLIDRIIGGEALPFDDLDSVLYDALSTRDARRAWIVENWPYVVEAAEIATGLAADAAEMTIDELAL